MKALIPERVPLSGDQMDTDKIELLDEGIRVVVGYLVGLGWQTTTSCQGGDGHSFVRPTVGLDVDFKELDPRMEMRRLARCLISGGWNGFHISYQESYQRALVADCNYGPSIFVEFWQMPLEREVRKRPPATGNP